MKYRAFHFIVAIFMCASPLLFGQTSTPYQFLRSEASARTAGLAGACTSITNDPSAMFYNPASVVTDDPREISATFIKQVLDINSGTITYTNTLNGANNPGAFAVGVNYLNYGNFDRADKNGIINGTFGANDISLVGAYSNYLDSNLSYGVSAELISNSLENTGSTAIAFGAGILYQYSKPNSKSKTNIGFSILHAGFQLSKIGGTSESLPTDVRLGINHRLRGLPLLINLSFNRLADSQTKFGDRFLNFSIGGEFYFGKAVQVRFGYDNQKRRELSPDTRAGMSGFSFGLGIVTAQKLKVDYAMNLFGIGGTQHRISIGMQL